MWSYICSSGRKLNLSCIFFLSPGLLVAELARSLLTGRLHLVSGGGDGHKGIRRLVDGFAGNRSKSDVLSTDKDTSKQSTQLTLSPPDNTDRIPTVRRLGSAAAQTQRQHFSCRKIEHIRRLHWNFQEKLRRSLDAYVSVFCCMFYMRL